MIRRILAAIDKIDNHPAACWIAGAMIFATLWLF